MKTSSSRHQLHLTALGLVLLTCAAYWRVCGCEFTNYDDTQYVLWNTHVRTGLSPANLAWAFNLGYASNWHPLTWMSHMLDCTLFGLKPAGHHAVNLLLHLANTVLLFLLLNKLTKSHWKSALVAALFAVHPLHVESVAWIAERKDVLSALFWMLTMWAYVRYTERPSTKHYALVGLSFAFGLMAKPMLVTLPLMLLLLDYWPLGRFGGAQAKSRKKAEPWIGWRLIREKLPLIGLSAVSSALTFIAQRRGESVASMSRVPVVFRVENSLISYASYLLKTVWPRGLAPFYPYPMEAIAVWKVAASILVLTAISLLVYSKRRTAPYLAFGWVWYLVTLLPVIGLVQVGAQSMADRYTYIPLIGVFVAIVWGVSGSIGNKAVHRTALTAASLVVVVVLAACTWVQAGYWQNSIALFTHTMNVTENNYTAYANLATAYAAKKDYAEAESYYVRALKFRSDTATLHFDYANTLHALGKVDQAAQEYAEALRLKPDFHDAEDNLSALKRKQEYAARAKVLLQQSGSNPADAATHLNKAVALDAEGKSVEAEREYREAIRLNPDFAEAHSNYGVLLRNKGDLDGAIREYQEAVRIKPEFVQAYMNMAIAYFLKGDYAGAWNQVYEVRKHGANPSPDFLQALSTKMPDPGQ